MLTEDFSYDLPEEAIAQQPVEPRHDARLLDTRDLSDRRFHQLPGMLEPGDLVVVNETKVRAARLHGSKIETGGRVEALLLRRLDPERWEALVRPARRLGPGVALRFGELEAEVLTEPVDGRVTLRIEADEETEAVIARTGELPLPPYITSRLEDPERYQTIFARTTGSAAAPTAGLHFTDQVVAGLVGRGIELARVDLEVGIGTFRPIAVDRIEDHVMHRESFRVPEATAEAIARTRRRGGRVVAVGTTTVRTLESAARPDGSVESGPASTELFLRPGSEFRVVDALVTNFHLPRSSLIVMIAAFMGDGWRGAYATALSRGYRFLSLGDAMYCERSR